MRTPRFLKSGVVSTDDPPPIREVVPETGASGGQAALEVVRAINVSKGTTVADRVQWAGSGPERRRGLLGRERLDPNEGIYIVPTQWIHTFGMRFSIDVAFLDSRGRVLFAHHHLRPNRLSRPVWRAEGALELAAGTLRATRTAVGDAIEFE